MRKKNGLRLRELLVKVLEGRCERLPDEGDEDYLTRCGNQPWSPIGTPSQRSNLPNPLRRGGITPNKPE